MGPAGCPAIMLESGRSECEFHVDSRVASAAHLPPCLSSPGALLLLQPRSFCKRMGQEVEATPKGHLYLR